jgi:hypothetical protein
VDRKNKKSSHLETFLSMVILSGLTAVGIGIWLNQSSYNPAVLNPDFVITQSEKSPGSPKPHPGESLLPTPQGIVPLSPPEVFDSQTLSDKIDGKAELYLSAGFSRLQTQRFKSESEPNLWMEVFIYDMGTGQNAFSVYSAQRRDDARSLELTQYSYETNNALFLVHGVYYLEIIASEASKTIFQPVKQLAQDFIRNTRAETKSIAEEDLFPKLDLVENSISLIASDAFGFERLDHVFTARYNPADAEAMAFLSNRKTKKDARELAAAYQEFLIAFGGRNVETDLPIEGAVMVEILETYEVIFSCGPYFAGVRELEDKHRARELAIRLFEKLKESQS